MKDVYKVDDAKAYALKEIEKEIKREVQFNIDTYDAFKASEDYWAKQADLYRNVSVSDISKEDYIRAKQFAQYLAQSEDYRNRFENT